MPYLCLIKYSVVSIGVLITSLCIYQLINQLSEEETITNFDSNNIILLHNQQPNNNIMGGQEKLSAFVFGWTGGVGKAIVSALASEPRFNKVTLFGRKQIQLTPPPSKDSASASGSAPPADYSKFEQQIINFDNLESLPSNFLAGYNVGFYTLGVSSTAVDKETYKKIEYGYTMAIAKLAASAGVSHFHWLSGNGANKNSWFLFGRTKAQIEEELAGLGFGRVSCYRPGGILTNEASGGMAGSGTVKILRALDRWNKISIEAEVLGRVIVANTFRETGNKSEILTNADINKFGKSLEQQGEVKCCASGK